VARLFRLSAAWLLACLLLCFLPRLCVVDCPQVQYSLALGYSRARIRRRTVHFWRSAYSALDCFAATPLVAFVFRHLVVHASVHAFVHVTVHVALHVAVHAAVRAAVRAAVHAVMSVVVHAAV
jgi:hypothetical protein